MTDIPLLDAPAGATVPVHAVRASEWETWAEARPETLRRFARAHDFRGQAGRILLVPATDGAIERVLFGLGDKPTPMLFGALGQHLPAGDYTIAWAPREFDATAMSTAWAMGAYAFARYKPRKRPIPRLITPDGADTIEATRIADAVYFARDLVNTPANDRGPEALHATAEKVAARSLKQPKP